MGARHCAPGDTGLVWDRSPPDPRSTRGRFQMDRGDWMIPKVPSNPSIPWFRDLQGPFPTQPFRGSVIFKDHFQPNHSAVPRPPRADPGKPRGAHGQIPAHPTSTSRLSPGSRAEQFPARGEFGARGAHLKPRAGRRPAATGTVPRPGPWPDRFRSRGRAGSAERPCERSLRRRPSASARRQWGRGGTGTGAASPRRVLNTPRRALRDPEGTDAERQPRPEPGTGRDWETLGRWGTPGCAGRTGKDEGYCGCWGKWEGLGALGDLGR